jgi:hypothetical protein
MNFDGVEKIAAAILYEGYILYPYRPSAIKNRQRWNFGTLYPQPYAEAQRPPEPFRLVAECLVVAEANAALDVRLSFLQLLRQQQASSDCVTNEFALSDPSLEWEEAIERTLQHYDLHLKDFVAQPLTLALQMERTPASDSSNGEQATDLKATLTIAAALLPEGAYKLHFELQNTSPLLHGTTARRDEALPRSFVSAHLLLGITGGEFVSLLDPGEIHRESAAACHNVGVFPVLLGDESERSMMLCSPIILYDYPKVAPESSGDFFDGTEMDEMLTLRVLTLTDAERQEMRECDPLARRILERAESITPGALLKAHGIIRGLREIRGDAQ